MSRDEENTPTGGDETVDPELLELEAELRLANDELAAAEEARAKKGRLVEMRDTIATAQRKKAEEVALAEAIEKHGALGKNIDRVDISGIGMFIVRRPDPIKIKLLFEKAQNKDTTTLDETFEQARPYIIYPTLAKADAIYGESPLIAHSLSAGVLKLAGFRMQKVSGK